jgi:hypothetical protein
MRLPPNKFTRFQGGRRSQAFVEAVDIYPTLVEAAMMQTMPVSECE